MSDARTHDVPELTVTALGRKVVIKFISSFSGQRENFVKAAILCVSVRACVYMCVCACPQQLSALERLCVWSPFGQLSTFLKDLSPAAGKKWSRRGNRRFHSELLVRFSQSVFFFFFFFKDITPPPSDSFGRSGDRAVCTGGALWAMGKGLCFSLSFSPLPLHFFPL